MTALPPTWSPPFAPTPPPGDPLRALERRIAQGATWATRAAAGHELPRPHRDLLVHDRDMTSTIERFHHEPVLLEVLERELRGTRLSRRVRLRGQRSGTVHVAAAVSIRLENLPLTIQALVLSGRRPLGAILAEASLSYRNEPDLYFRLDAVDEIAADLEVAPGAVVWGRRNVLWSSAGRLADVIEILPALAPPAG